MFYYYSLKFRRSYVDANIFYLFTYILEFILKLINVNYRAIGILGKACLDLESIHLLQFFSKFAFHNLVYILGFFFSVECIGFILGFLLRLTKSNMNIYIVRTKARAKNNNKTNKLWVLFETNFSEFQLYTLTEI